MTQHIESNSGNNFPTEALRRPRIGILKKLRHWLFVGFIGLVAGGMLLWAALAIYYADTHTGPRTWRAGLFILMALYALFFIRPRRYGLVTFALLFLAVLAWFFSIKASNDRDWLPDVTAVSWAQVDGDLLTVHNIRNIDYRSETDFTPRWVDRTYNLSKLRTFDFMLVYWGSPAIAHAMVSFGFEDGRYLAVSIETRKERTESYSTVEGFFRQYELIYIFADERDVVRLRTNFRNEDVYLYRTNLTPMQTREVLMSYVEGANSMKDKPVFYNALTDNCATTVVRRVQNAGGPGKMSWKILLSGYAASQAYDNGRIDTQIPFDELKKRSYINEIAHGAGNGEDFSEKIRVHLPQPQPSNDPGAFQPARP